MAIKTKNKVNINFNMSSMTDIVFLLLIFFIITSTLINPNSLKLTLPNSDAQGVAKQNVAVAITKDLTYAVNKKVVPFNEIEPLLKAKLQKEKKPAIILYAEKEVPIEEVVKIMDIAKRNKYELVLATSPK